MCCISAHSSQPQHAQILHHSCSLRVQRTVYIQLTSSNMLPCCCLRSPALDITRLRWPALLNLAPRAHSAKRPAAGGRPVQHTLWVKDLLCLIAPRCRRHWWFVPHKASTFAEFRGCVQIKGGRLEWVSYLCLSAVALRKSSALSTSRGTVCSSEPSCSFCAAPRQHQTKHQCQHGKQWPSDVMRGSNRGGLSPSEAQ